MAHVLARPSQEDHAHRHRTAHLTSKVAARMDITPEEIEQARLGAILHDVGQIAVPQPVFMRPGPLWSEPDDRAKMEAHPHRWSADRRCDAGAAGCAVAVIGAHHERQDGAGYPDGLTGEAIPGPARAFQVADAYDAMTCGRPHAPARSHAAAIAELEANAGQQHDDRAVRALAYLGEDGLAEAPQR